MKKSIIVFVFIIGIGSLGIYAQTKNEDILKLLMISGSAELADQTINAMIPQFKQLVPIIPDSFWAKLRDRLNIDDFLHSCVPVYSKYYTHDEIKQLIEIYESPLGKKMVKVTPFLTEETMVIGQKWGEKLGQEIADELIAEGYLDL